MQDGISLGTGMLWVMIWFGCMLLYTLLDVAVWRKLTAKYEQHLNVVTIAVSIVVYLGLLTGKNDDRIDWFRNISWSGVILALGCAALLYFLLDKGIDPVLERIFPTSEKSYQDTLETLRKAPVASLLQVGILAPVIEEVLMRGYLLQGLSIRYGSVAALLVSSFLFALLHFNMVQTFSALICGIVLGLLYLQTGSILCCILTHMSYNLISYLTMIAPLFKKSDPT